MGNKWKVNTTPLTSGLVVKCSRYSVENDVRTEKELKRKAESKNNVYCEEKMGPKMRLNKLMQMGYSDDFAIQELKKIFPKIQNEDKLFREWVKELKQNQTNKEGDWSNER